MPSDAKSVQVEVSGNGNTVVVNGTNAKTILGVAMQQSNTASDTSLRCGTTILAKNYATNFSYVPLNKVCYGTINIEKTGADTASVVINYVTYDMSLKPTTTIQDVYNNGQLGLNANEWLFIVAIFLFFISWKSWGAISIIKST